MSAPGAPGSTFPGIGAVQFFSVALPAVFWPLVVTLIAWTQREPIGRLIDRVRSGRLFGQEFDAPPPGLAEAAEGGASSPEVEELIRSVSEEGQALLEGRQALLADPDEDPASVDPMLPESTWATLLARLLEATQNDENHRRSEIERVMQSSARWGAQVARSRPNDDYDWEPFVRWKDNGEPEIVAIQGSAALDRQMRELRAAGHLRDAALKEYMDAQHEVQDARKALDESPEATLELQERVKSAETRHDQAAALAQRAQSEWQAKRRSVDLG
jgi:hypothetical protein